MQDGGVTRQLFGRLDWVLVWGLVDGDDVAGDAHTQAYSSSSVNFSAVDKTNLGVAIQFIFLIMNDFVMTRFCFIFFCFVTTTTCYFFPMSL